MNAPEPAEQPHRGQPKQWMIVERGGNIQMCERDPGPAHTAARAGNTEQIFNRTGDFTDKFQKCVAARDE